MDPKVLLSKSVKKIVGVSNAKRKSMPDAPAIPKATFDKLKQSNAEFFTAGFGKTRIVPPDLLRRKYYIAGYNMNNPAKGLLDVPYAHALWLDDNSGRGGMLFVSLDAVGMLNQDVNAVKASLSDFIKETGCRSINIMCTHSHAGIDTMGLWGPLPRTGRDPKYMEVVFTGIREAVKKAYEDRREGSLNLGTVEVEGMQNDHRLPVIYSKTLTRLRFVPNDGTREIYFINFAAHSESLGGDNSLVSADFPCYLREEILKRTGAETVYCVGAIGGMISMDRIGDDKIESTKKIGRNLAEFALSITDEKKLVPTINFLKQEFYAEVDNYVLMLGTKVGILKADRYTSKDASYGYTLKSEMTYIEIGSLKMLLLPCEIFPELVFGGYLSSEESAEGKGPEVNPIPLTQIAGEEQLLIFGLANDELGYVIPPNDFLLAPGIPYLDRVKDRLDRNHYEETNSMGPKTAPKLAEVFTEMMATVKAAGE
ncbi:MAG: neutral/alkaline non-lysosomal ceramidase N-terminal domain-containing protein [Eubacteriales bacterium]